MDAKLEKIFERLEKERIRLFNSLNSLTESQFRHKPAPGKWSIGEIVHHLLLSEQGSYRYMTRKNQAESLPRLGLPAAFRSAALTASLRLPLKYKAPNVASIQPSGEASWDTLKEDWEETRKNLREFIDALPRERMKAAIYRHPYAGYFTVYQTLKFFEEHFQHHLKQIERIRAADGFPG